MCRSDVRPEAGQSLARLLVDMRAALCAKTGTDPASCRIGPVDFGFDAGLIFPSEPNYCIEASTMSEPAADTELKLAAASRRIAELEREADAPSRRELEGGMADDRDVDEPGYRHEPPVPPYGHPDRGNQPCPQPTVVYVDAGPNPGSEEAMCAGCECPVVDNNLGRFPPPDGWWISSGCPVHDGSEPVADRA